MPSAKKTPNIGLNDWTGNEYVKRQDFCDDNLIIDKEIGNLKATYAEVTLETGKWSGQTYSLEATYPSATYDIEIELSGNATKDIAKVWGKVIPVPSPDGKNIIKALGTVPSINIPIRVKAVKK